MALPRHSNRPRLDQIVLCRFNGTAPYPSKFAQDNFIHIKDEMFAEISFLVTRKILSKLFEGDHPIPLWGMKGISDVRQYGFDVDLVNQALLSDKTSADRFGASLMPVHPLIIENHPNIDLGPFKRHFEIRSQVKIGSIKFENGTFSVDQNSLVVLLGLYLLTNYKPTRDNVVQLMLDAQFSIRQAKPVIEKIIKTFKFFFPVIMSAHLAGNAHFEIEAQDPDEVATQILYAIREDETLQSEVDQFVWTWRHFIKNIDGDLTRDLDDILS